MRRAGALDLLLRAGPSEEADKTALKIMGEMGLRCGIRRETDYHKYNSYKGLVGKTFENVLGRDWDDFESFKADLEAYIVHWNTRRRH